MCKQIIIGGVVGGIALFMWGFVSWVVLPWHYDGTFRQDDRVMAVIKDIENQLPETGVYSFPPMPLDQRDKASMEAWEEQYRSGPSGVIFYTAEHGDVMDPMQLLKGYASYVVSAMFASLLLLVAMPVLPTYTKRVAFVASLGIFSLLSIHLVDGMFLHLPLRYTMGMMADTAISWVLAGLVIGALVRKPNCNA